MAFTVDIRGNASHLERTLGLAKNRIGDLGNAAKMGLGAITALGAAGAAGIGAFVISSSKAAADIEDLSIQLGVLTGSAATAADLIKTFRDEEKKSALNITDYSNAAKTMLAFGTSLDDVVPSLKMIGDVSMGNSERFASLSLAFAQTTAAGRLMGQEVLQFVNAGFNPLEQIARDTGRSMKDLKKDMEDGKISVQMVKQAFISATSEGGRFYKAIEKGSASTSAKINQFGAAVTQLKVAFGTGFNDGLKVALDATNNFLPQLEVKFKEAGEMVGGAIAQAVQGNTAELAAVGAFIGEVVFAGFKSVYLRMMDELVSDATNAFTVGREQIGGLLTGNPMGMKEAVGNVAARGGVASPMSTAGYLQAAMVDIAESENLKALQDASFNRRMNNVFTEGAAGQTKNEVKEGVKEGMREVWYSLETGAKFSN